MNEKEKGMKGKIKERRDMKKGKGRKEGRKEVEVRAKKVEDIPFEAPSHWFYFQGWTESSKQKIRGRTEGGGRKNTMDGWIH